MWKVLGKLLSWGQPREKPVATFICARVGESLAPPPGSVVRQCERCYSDITVAPLSFYKAEALGMRLEAICVQCAAKEDPDAEMPPMDVVDYAQFVQNRGGPPDQSQIRTIGDMNKHMNTLFPDRSEE